MDAMCVCVCVCVEHVCGGGMGTWDVSYSVRAINICSAFNIDVFLVWPKSTQ